MAYGIYNGGAAHTIRYRFTCSNCGQTTDWNDYEVKIGYIVRVRGTYNAEQLKRGEQAALTEKITRMKLSIAKGYQFESPFMEKTEYSYDMERTCPFCGAKQRNKGGLVEYDWNDK